MLRLFLEGQELELTDNIQVAITKQFEDLTNPTKIKNDWSKTVSIPFTHKNDAIFGYFFRPDKLVTYKPTNNYLTTAPTSIKKWNGTDYVNDSLVNGEIVCNLNPQYVQVGFQYQDWEYSNVKNYTCNNDWHSFEFIYDATDDYRFEFSFRDMSSDAPNNEVYFAQWSLYDRNLTPGETYIVSFKHRKEGSNYIIYDYSLSQKQSLTGINFDPLQKLDFRLEWDSATVMQGYAKLTEIKQQGGKGTYEITLNGQLGKIFQEMQKITFDTATDDTQYLIHGEDYVKEYISYNLVRDSWNSSGQSSYTLKKKGDTGYRVTDIIGFAPNNSFSEGFDYKSYVYENKIMKFTDTLGDSFTTATGVSPDTAIPNGMLPREIGEYRSYNQLPFIYWNKLFQIFQEKAEKLTNYQFDLDPDWFNENNPYWSKLIMMLKTFKTDKDEGSKHNLYTMRQSDLWWTGTSTTWGSEQWVDLMAFSAQEQLPILSSGTGVTPAIFDIPNDETTININFEVPMYIQSATVIKNSSIQPVKIANGILYLTLSVYDSDDNEITRRVYKLRPSQVDPDDNYGEFNQVIVFENGSPTRQTGYYYYWDFTIKDAFSVTNYDAYTGGVFSGKFKFTWTAQWTDFYDNYLSSNPILVMASSAYYSDKAVYVRNDWDATVQMDITSGLKRSYSGFILNDLWNKEFNLFDVILNYCKMYRILIMSDDVEKKIKFIPAHKFFSSYNVLDWTNNVDKSKDFKIQPITFNKKYILFNYKDNKTNLGEEYKKKFGVNYGDYRISTDYNFNTDKEELFKNVISSMVNTDNILSWSNLIGEGSSSSKKIMYSFPSEISVYNKNKDKKNVDVFGSFFFHNGTRLFDTESALNLRTVRISDDTTTEVSNNTYCYAQRYTDIVPRYVQVTTYPNIDVVYGNNMCIFNTPSENYTYLQNYGGKDSIYSNIWSNYISERYNRQNKLVTCYVRLKPTDYNKFKFNNFVKIDTQLYMVNKIYDYDVTSNNSTKVDLISIQDTDGYTKCKYFTDNDFLTLWSGTRYISGSAGITAELGTFETLTDVTFSNNQKTYTTNNITFTIQGNKISATTLSNYVDSEDLSLNITVHNASHTATFNVVRYAVYPYPWIIVEDGNGNEVSTIYPGSRVYKLKWHGTETEGLANKPTVTISTSHATGSATIQNDWVENEVCIQEGGDEWFRNEYEVTMNTNLTNYSGDYITITVTDAQGWHETRNYNISI